MRRLMMVFRLVAIAFLSVLPVLVATPPIEAASLGGSMSFSGNPQITMAPGQTLPPVNYLLVENTGDAAADVRFQWNSGKSTGIKVQIDRTEVRLAPGAKHRFLFGIEVTEAAAAGSHTIFVEAKQTNLPAGEIVAPAVGGRIQLTVVGETATYTVRAISNADGAPVKGHFSIGYVGAEGRQFPVADADGTEITRNGAPGNYRATFGLAGLVQKSIDFALQAGENKVVEIKLDTITFALVAATPKPTESDVVSADLVASVKNNLKELPGPASIDVRVLKDGSEIDIVNLQRQPILPLGFSEGRESFIPSGGWSPGTYTFHFSISAPGFTVESQDIPQIEIPRLRTGAVIAVAVAGVGLVIVVVGVVLWIRRRP